jgi:hypothetical protein
MDKIYRQIGIVAGDLRDTVYQASRLRKHQSRMDW